MTKNISLKSKKIWKMLNFTFLIFVLFHRYIMWAVVKEVFGCFLIQK